MDAPLAVVELRYFKSAPTVHPLTYIHNQTSHVRVKTHWPADSMLAVKNNHTVSTHQRSEYFDRTEQGGSTIEILQKNWNCHLHRLRWCACETRSRTAAAYNGRENWEPKVAVLGTYFITFVLVGFWPVTVLITNPVLYAVP